MGRRGAGYNHVFGKTYDRLPLCVIDGIWKCCYLLPCRLCVYPCLEGCLYQCVCKYGVKGVLCCPCYCYCCYEDSLCGNGKGTKAAPEDDDEEETKKGKKGKKEEEGKKKKKEEERKGWFGTVRASAQPQFMERDEAPVLLPMLAINV